MTLYSLDVQERKRYRFPKVVTVLARHLEVFVELLLNQRVVLHRDSVPHEVLLRKNNEATSVRVSWAEITEIFKRCAGETELYGKGIRLENGWTSSHSQQEGEGKFNSAPIFD